MNEEIEKLKERVGQLEYCLSQLISHMYSLSVKKGDELLFSEELEEELFYLKNEPFNVGDTIK